MAGSDRLASIRRAILREWRGGDDPGHLDDQVHQASRFVDAILRQAGAAGGIDEERLREMWREIAGEFVARHAAPESLRNGCLTLRVLQPAMRFHLEQARGELLANLRRAAGDGVVTSVRFSVG